MRCYAEKVVQLCASLVNFQYPFIKEISDSLEFVMIAVELKSDTAQFSFGGKIYRKYFWSPKWQVLFVHVMTKHVHVS